MPLPLPSTLRHTRWPLLSLDTLVVDNYLTTSTICSDDFTLLFFLQVAAAPTLKDRIPGYSLFRTHTHTHTHTNSHTRTQTRHFSTPAFSTPHTLTLTLTLVAFALRPWTWQPHLFSPYALPFSRTCCHPRCDLSFARFFTRAISCNYMNGI